MEDFGFDFGEVEPARPVAAPAAPPPAAPPPPRVVDAEPSGETEEDLWSEVSLRDRVADVLEPRPVADAGGWEAGGVTLEEPAVADESLFDEMPGAQPAAVPAGEVQEPTAAPEFAVAAAGMVEPALVEPAMPEASAEPMSSELAAPIAEAPPSAASAAAAPPGQLAAAVVDAAHLERLVAERLDVAVRQALAAVVGDVARTMVESVAWEVIPELAEAMIRAEIERIRQSNRAD
jgi:hypothetical protein